MNALQQSANAVRILSIDAVEAAQSGHPGMPLGMADIATVLWQRFLRHNPANPYWFNRDRFVLSNGHGSMLLYALLHLTGYGVSLDDLKQFRQLHSKTPGHPEFGETPGVETTTGPLGQGFANAVGMALAEALLAYEYNKEDLTLVDHHTYAFVGDGCLMEGISHEVASLAGTLALGKLIVFYDSNHISIDGHTDNWFGDDTAMRFRAYHWHVIDEVDGHDFEAIEAAIYEARAETAKPSLIICRTTIGFASPLAGSERAHGAPLGAQNIQHVRDALNWQNKAFSLPAHIYAEWQVHDAKAHEDAWLLQCHHYQARYPEQYQTFLRRINGDLPDDWPSLTHEFVQKCVAKPQNLATRKSSQACLDYFGPLLPELFGGSADLTASNNTDWHKSVPLAAKQCQGNYLHYGVREFGMAAMMNGMSLHGGFIPYGGTFLVFSDYARNAIRLSALMRQRVIYVLTHDSIGLGEDGPTHQPIEHAAMLRLTPNLNVWRPADLTETAVAWQEALSTRFTPSALLLSRQTLPALNHDLNLTDIARGGYILSDEDDFELILIATGSEVQLMVKAATILRQQGIATRMVSMPCCERFLAQDRDYQEKILPNAMRKRIAVEAGSRDYWYRFVGLDGQVIGLDRFGVSAPATDAYAYLGITVEAIVAAAHHLIQHSS
ncbi:MAG TPA: transketolase [Legionellales bacterium]|nr:transketolase [Legionellales bacterium]